MHLLWLLSLVCLANGAPFPACPSDCECLTVDMVTTTRCLSLAFIQDAPADQLNKVSHLDVRHSNLTKIASVRKLHGLKTLNMAHNDIRHVGDLISLSKLSVLNLRGNKLKTLEEPHLPKNLEHLDVSSNHLATFPSFDQLKRLREVNLAGNPFMCTCELKTKCEDLQKLVTLVKPVTCRDGSGHVRTVSELNCSGIKDDDHLGHNDLEKMQNDEGFEGSGEEPEDHEVETTDIFAESAVGDPKKLAEMQNEELLPAATTKLPELREDDYEYEEEGSGHSGDTPGSEYEDEGSGSEVLIIPSTEEPLKACNFNCTPITLDEPSSSNSTEPDPNLMDEVSKAIQGIFSEDDEDKPKEETETSEEGKTEAPMVNVEVKKSETGRSGDGVPIVINEEEKVHAAEDTEASEVKEAGSSVGMSNNMIVIIALIVIMICIIVYTILVKRRKNRRRLQTNGSSAPGQEMKVIKPIKPARQSLPPSDKGKVPEKVPLMNGQNDSATPKNGGAIADASTPLINEPELEKEEQPVQMRSPRGDHSPLLPETHKVTVQAKELTRPKTPLLVTRVRSQDGQIVTTPEADQRH